MTKKVDLNNITTFKDLDSFGMIKYTSELPEQFEKALQIMRNFLLPPNFPIPKNIVISGTGGGSAIAGNMITSLFFSEIKCPIFINQGYKLPGWVDRNTVVFSVTYSGNTEETISTFKQALKNRAKVIVITTGGELASLAEENYITIVDFPDEGMQARSAIAYLFVPILLILERFGMINAQPRKDLNEVITLLKELRIEYGVENPTEKNQAKFIAQSLFNKIPIIYSSDELTNVAAMRWKNQFAENSKILSHYNTFPELNHDEIVGWEAPIEKTKYWQPVFLKDKSDDIHVSKRMEITSEIISNKVDNIININSKGNSSLARLLSLIYLGDWVSIYLAFLYGIDPTPVNTIVKMKEMLKNSL